MSKPRGLNRGCTAWGQKLGCLPGLAGFQARSPPPSSDLPPDLLPPKTALVPAELGWHRSGSGQPFAYAAARVGPRAPALTRGCWVALLSQCCCCSADATSSHQLNGGHRTAPSNTYFLKKHQRKNYILLIVDGVSDLSISDKRGI